MHTRTRTLLVEVHNAIEIVRNLLQGNMNAASQIDDAYEEVLINDMKHIPEQYDEEILEIINVVKTVLKHIDFTGLCKEIGTIAQKSKYSYIFEVDTFRVFETCVNKIEMKKLDRARIVNIVTKFKPLFNCIDCLASEPLKLICGIAHISDSLRNESYKDILS